MRGVAVGVVGRRKGLAGISREAGAFVLHLVLQHPLKADAVVEQEVPLGLRRKVAAADQPAAGGGPPLLDQEFFHAAVLFGVVEVATKGGAVVVVAAAGIGNEG